ncbi:MAG: phosphonate ABC transporter ATP-binding protein [Deltaproteobacteria bacterium]|nr:phosphonate ABC transporter ATP-binding protein [Deltaproteobacteria bacterium]
MLRLDNIVKNFGGTRAVNNVSISIPNGQMVGIIGRSGAGKSTLLRLINRLLDPCEGQIEFENSKITALKGRSLLQWRARCAMIFQQFNLVGRLNVLTNVLLGRLAYHRTLPTLIKHFSKTEKAMAIHALERLDMASTAFQRADTLSGGQQQRVAIGRALMQDPKMILADEPIASLDPHNARKVMEALRCLNQENGITVLCNLHHLESARMYCDRVIGMFKGSIAFDGTPADLTPAKVCDIYGSDEHDEELEEAFGSTFNLDVSSLDREKSFAAA